MWCHRIRSHRSIPRTWSWWKVLSNIYWLNDQPADQMETQYISIGLNEAPLQIQSVLSWRNTSEQESDHPSSASL